MLRMQFRTHRKIYIIVFAILLAAAVAWAASKLSGQANQKSLEAAGGSAEMEMVTLDTLKPPKKAKAPNCNWQKEKKLRHAIKANDKQYQQLVAKAKAEVAGQARVSEKSKTKVMESAQAYCELQNQYADMWQSCKCKTRSNLARKLAASRLKNAEVVVSEIDEEKLEEMEQAQNEVRQARREYAEHAKANDELSAKDKKDIQANVLPQTEKMLSEFKTLASSVMSLLNEIKSTASQATSGSISGLFSATKKMVGQGGAGLLSQVKMLGSVTKNMISNVKDLQTDARMLSE